MTVHIYQHGGIGDQILGLPFINLFRDEGVTLYTIHGDVVKIFLPWVEVKQRTEFRDPLWWIELTDVVRFKGSPPRTRYYEHWLSKYNGAWKTMIDRHPMSCNEIGRMGIHRTRLAHWLIGAEYKALDVGSKDSFFTDKFITVHDGFDETHKHDVSMKSWPHWAELITLLAKFGMPVVQLGGKKCKPIPGVTRNQAGKLAFVDSLLLLSQSTLHIDSDSGLVHARALYYSNPSIVLFGPTDIRYFGYPQNINLAPPVGTCVNCWWLRSDWMRDCVNGYGTPARCMSSITAATVAKAVENFLGGNEN